MGRAFVSNRGVSCVWTKIDDYVIQALILVGYVVHRSRRVSLAQHVIARFSKIASSELAFIRSNAEPQQGNTPTNGQDCMHPYLRLS